MKKIVLVPDSFKGTLSSSRAAEAMAKATRRAFPGAEIVAIPVADGGEGTVEAFLEARGGHRVTVEVKGPRGNVIPAFYGILPDKTAVVEMAAAAGLPLMEGNLDVGGATTYGVGELMKAAVAKGAKKLILGLGGSATNDGGCGAAAALGAKFFDGAGKAFVPTGSTLGEISSIDAAGLYEALKGVEVVVMSDIDNPLCGERGAAAVFGPQKGASEAQVKELDAGLAHLAKIIKRDLNKDVANLPGAGAAGGMGAGAAAFFGGRLTRGIDAVLDAVDFSAALRGADVVVTGEGRFDEQSLMGKVVGGIAARTRAVRAPLIVVAGSLAKDIDFGAAKRAGIDAAFSVTPAPMSFAEAARDSFASLENAILNIWRLWSLAESGCGNLLRR